MNLIVMLIDPGSLISGKPLSTYFPRTRHNDREGTSYGDRTCANERNGCSPNLVRCRPHRREQTKKRRPLVREAQ